MPPLTRVSITLAAAAIALASAGAAQAQDPVRVYPTFNEGETARYEHHLRTSQSQALPGAAAEVRLDCRRWCAFEVKQVSNDGVATVELRLTRITMELDAPGIAPLEFDSDRPPQEDGPGRVSKMLRQIMETPVTYEMAPDGRIITIDGPGEISDFIGDARDVGFLQSIFGETWYRLLAQDIWTAGPGTTETMRVGQSWTEEAPTEVGGLRGVNSSITFTLDSATQETATFVGQGELDVQLDKAFGGTDVEVVEERMEFETVWSRDRGRAHSVYTIQELRLAFTDPEVGRIGTMAFFTEAIIEPVGAPEPG